MSSALPTAQAAGGQGKLKVLGGVRGAQVFIDGENVGTLPLRHAVTVEAGNVDLEVRADGYPVFRRQVEVPKFQRVRVRVDMRAASEPAPAEVVQPTLPAPALVAPAPVTSAPLAVPVAAYAAPAAVVPVPVVAAPEVAVATPSLYPANASSLQPLPLQAEVAPAPQAAPAEVAPVAVPAGSPPVAATTYTQPAAVPLPAPMRDLSPRATAEVAADAEMDYVARPLVSEQQVDALAEDDDPLDLFIFELTGGHSTMFMALGRNDSLAALGALSEEELGELSAEDAARLQELSIGDMVNTVSGGGPTIGGAASIRLAFISLGTRLNYAAYDDLSIMTLTAELAFRLGGDPVEAYMGFGMGAGWLYDVPEGLATEDSGLAMRTGLGLNFRLHQNVSLGAGVEAVGLFLAGDGVNPAQVNIDMETDHPIGVQFPITANLSILL